MVSTRVLVVANRTAATPALLDAVRERAARGPCTFTLLVPNPVRGIDRATDPEGHDRNEGEAVLALALPLLEDAAGGPVEGRVGDPDALAAIQDVVNFERYDEILISTLPSHVSRWLHLDLPRKVAGLGLPVTTVTARARQEVPAVAR
jgi:hypothetical protein